MRYLVPILAFICGVGIFVSGNLLDWQSASVLYWGGFFGMMSGGLLMLREMLRLNGIEGI